MVRTAFVSTYPPRHCGIATFTNYLGRVTTDREIVAIHPPETPVSYPLEVHHRIRRDEPSDYIRTARALRPCVGVVSIQHAYGIWGGDDGEAVLDFARALEVPAVATLHTILREPTPRQHAILVELIDRVRATVVMSRAAAALLASAYGVDPARVEVIAHGVPELPMVRSETMKAVLGLAGHEIILSFGLMGPRKGYELALEALPAVVAEHPKVRYVIIGATHPDLVRREGEAYRDALVARARRLGLADHVLFVDRFVDRVELTRWLELADVFVTPYQDLDQVVSGTLAYAMGAGRAIVSTPYAHARELLAGDRGILVPPGSPDALAAALNRLLGDDELRAATGRRAYDHSRRTVWSAIGGEYQRLFARVAADVTIPVSSTHLAAITA